MSIDGEIYEKIFEITRGDLEQASFPFPRIGSLTDQFECTRVTCLSRFWKRRENDETFLLEQSTADLVAGLYGQTLPWVFMLRGGVSEITCWYGVPKRVSGGSSFHVNLSGVFPGIRMTNGRPLDEYGIERLRHALVMTGTPSPRTGNENGSHLRGDQIEKICRGLYGMNWLYIVHAEPVSSAEIARLINELSHCVRNAHAMYLLKGSATDERNRIAVRYVDLLEAKLRRYEQGRVSGLWNTQVYLFATEADVIERAKGLLCSAFSGDKSLPDPVRVRPCRNGQKERPSIEPLTSGEVAILTRPPQDEYPGYEIIEYFRFGVQGSSFKGTVINVGDVVDLDRNTGNSFRIPRRDLAKHALIVGTTGSGKTNTSKLLLDQIWDGGRGIPFLVIESAKSEYRNLLANPRFKGLNIFTMGDETTSPMRLNPFHVPDGILVQTHIDYIKLLFSAAFVLYPPMPYVLEQSIQEIYEDRGWDLARNLNFRGTGSPRTFPTLADLAAKISNVVGRMGYDDRLTMDVTAGLLARINQLRMGGGKGPMLDTRKSLDNSILFEEPCVIELKQVVSDEEKAFLIGLLLIRLNEHCEIRATDVGRELYHITLIEEAHRLLRNVSTEQGSDVVANPKGRAIEVFANILSEIRAYGEGFFIAEQIPTKLAPDAIKNTNLKIVHRLVSRDDREQIGGAMNLNTAQTRFLSTLPVGEAVVYMEGVNQAMRIKVPIAEGKDNPGYMSSQDVKRAMLPFWAKNGNVLMTFPGCAGCPTVEKDKACSFQDGRAMDVDVKIPATRLFNVLRLNKALVLDAYIEFNMVCQRRTGRRKQEFSPYCIFVGYLDAEMERRGEFMAWSHVDVERAIELASLVLARINRDLGKTERYVLEKAVMKELTVFSTLIKRLQKMENLPFIGCQWCQDPCYYRFDMTLDNSDMSVKDFRSAFFNLEENVDEMARICWNLSARSFHNKDIKSRRAASLCFGIQQFCSLDMTTINQQQMTKQLADNLDRFV